MKKIIVIILSILLMIGCSITEEEFPSSPDFSSESFDETSSVIESENEGYLGEIDGLKIYQKSLDKKHTHLQIEVGYYGELNTLKAESEIDCDYLITDSDGNLLIDHPFCEVHFLDPGSFGMPQDRYHITGNFEGAYYVYHFENGEFVLDDYKNAGEYEGIDSEFGYKRTRYYYPDCGTRFGLNDEYGNVIFEPVHDILGIPFSDRFILGSSNKEAVDPSSGMLTIIDVNGKCYAKFNDIDFYVFNDGSYIGMARNFSDALSTAKCYDENGNPWEYGFWFIDKNGNKLSPRYERLVSVKDRFNNIIKSPDDIITVLDENGNLLEFTAEKYLCK